MLEKSRKPRRKIGIGISLTIAIAIFISDAGNDDRAVRLYRRKRVTYTTCSTETFTIAGDCFTREFHRRATSWNSVVTGPGQSAVTVTDVSCNSARNASEKLVT